MKNGDIPDGKIVDHIDGNKINNDLSNLRLVTIRENGQNRYTHREGRLVGVSFHKHSGKFLTQITVDGIKKCLGFFNTEQEAHRVYIEETLTLLKEE